MSGISKTQLRNGFSDGDVKSSFNGSYTPFTDVKGKILKALNELHPDENYTGFTILKMLNGQVVKDASGAPVLDDVMIAKMTKSLSPEKIQAAIAASVSASDLNQLSINGRYEYKDLDKAGMKRVY